MSRGLLNQVVNLRYIAPLAYVKSTLVVMICFLHWTGIQIGFIAALQPEFCDNNSHRFSSGGTVLVQCIKIEYYFRRNLRVVWWPHKAHSTLKTPWTTIQTDRKSFNFLHFHFKGNSSTLRSARWFFKFAYALYFRCQGRVFQKMCSIGRNLFINPAFEDVPITFTQL